MPIRTARILLIFALAAASCAIAKLLKLSPFLLVASLISLIALPATRSRRELVFSLAALGLATLGFMRFLVVEAVPGIVAGGTRAAEDGAVSKLREILFAEDSLRRLGTIDPDGDHIGSAARIDELTGRAGVRGALPLAAPLLERYPESQETSSGEAVEIGGYFVLVCLPTPNGGFSAKLNAPVDEERAERRFLAYAWPAAADHRLSQAFFLDEHERIEVAPSTSLVRLGLDHPPACDDALSEPSKSDWRPWRNKRARDTLPGDRNP